jgi:type II secretory ATPase GspE/PulE/Tfp pilus assembly ATPase PilB-like protein
MELLMPDIFLSSIEYGGYISIIKFVILLALFFPLFPLLSWVFNDAEALEERTAFWTGIILAAAAVAIILWLVIPIFIIGMLFYIAAVSATSIAYIKTRNEKVLESDRVLTIEHIKGLFSAGEIKKAKTETVFTFVTANKNEVPVPEPKTADFFGYKTAYNLFTDANFRRATNIYLLPTQQNYNVIYEIDGIPDKQPPILKEQMEYLIKFIKNLGDLDTNEKRKPQKGIFKIRRDKNDADWEVITAGSTAGEQLHIRQRMQQNLKKIEELGFTNEQLTKLNGIKNLKQGIFIISGPPKSGVTTTFYAVLRNHDAFLNNINTLELEISATLPNISQEVFSLSDTGTTTFAKKLQSIIRMGPDIVGVTACHDSDTAKIICSASKDNKLLYVTMDAESVLHSLGKWIQFVGDSVDAIEPLICLCNQRLIRKLCDQCKQAYMPDRELLRKFNIPAEKAKNFYRAGKVQYDKHGKPVTCENCQGTGFLGRIAVFEIVFLDEKIKQSIKELKNLQEIGRQFRNAKMLYLQEQMLRKVIAGTTSVNEMVRVLSKSKKETEQKK